jgi:hypothetical protein
VRDLDQVDAGNATTSNSPPPARPTALVDRSRRVTEAATAIDEFDILALAVRRRPGQYGLTQRFEAMIAARRSIAAATERSSLVSLRRARNRS